MTLGGWFTFVLSVGAFSMLFTWCIYKVASTDNKKTFIDEEKAAKAEFKK